MNVYFNWSLTSKSSNAMDNLKLYDLGAGDSSVVECLPSSKYEKHRFKSSTCT